MTIRAIEIVKRQSPRPITLTIVGDGPERGALTSLSASLGLHSIITFTGWAEHDDAMAMLDRADALLHAADWEPYGVVILEAMARGKAVFATDATMAAVDRIRDRENGRLFRAGEPASLAEKILESIDRPESLHEMGRYARATAEEWPVDRAGSILSDALITNANSRRRD